jgi:hypothetical protein
MINDIILTSLWQILDKHTMSLCFAQKEFLITSHISGFAFDVICSENSILTKPINDSRDLFIIIIVSWLSALISHMFLYGSSVDKVCDMKNAIS